jgi:hypothetical protein
VKSVTAVMVVMVGMMHRHAADRRPNAPHAMTAIPLAAPVPEPAPMVVAFRASVGPPSARPTAPKRELIGASRP